MTAPIQYSLQIDTARDGTFAQSIDDITQYWIGQSQWNNGMGGSYDEVAPPARLTVQLSNRSGDFNPDGYLSNELITNGGFDSWTGDNPNSWTVVETGFSANVYEWGSGSPAGTGSCRFTVATTDKIASIEQLALESEKTYQVSVNVTHTFSGQRSPLQITSGSKHIGYVSQQGMHTFVFNAQSSSFKITSILLGGDVVQSDIVFDNVAIRQVSKYAMMNRGMQVRLRATYNGVTTTLFQGGISLIQYSVGRSTEPTVTLTIEDAMLQLLDTEYAPPLLIAPTVNSVLTRMFDDAVIRWPYSGGYWLLGIIGYSELNLTTYLYGHDVTDFETGLTTFEYTGDVEDRGEGISAQGFVRDIVAAEAGGRFWFDARTNKFKFHNRDHDPLNETIAGVYSESHFDSVLPKYGDDIINDLTLNYTSRNVGTAGSVLWSLKSIPFLLKNDSKRTFNARYFDVNNQQLHVGARTTILPEMGVDYVANGVSDGSGQVTSDKLSVSADPSGNSAKMTVSNDSGLDMYVTLLQLRGTPITQIEESYQNVDGASIAVNDLYPKVIEVRALDNTSLAENFVDYTLARFKNPIFRFETVTFSALNYSDGDIMADAAINRRIGDKITITDSSTSHNKNYILVGENHTLDTGGDKLHDVIWTLKPIDRDQFWMLETVGKSELGETTFLGF